MAGVKRTVSKSSVEMWDLFLRRYYWPKIMSFANTYPDETSFYVSFQDLEKWDFEIAEELLTMPEEVLVHASAALQAMDLPAPDTDLKGARIRIKHLPKAIPIKDIRSSEIGTLISVTGLVKKVTEVRPKVEDAAFECRRCGYVTVLPQGDHFIEPVECESEDCGRRGPFKFDEDLSRFVDFQKVRVQDSPDEVRPGEHPQTLDTLIKDDLTGRVCPGDMVTFVGILRSYQKYAAQGKSTVFDLLLDVVSVEVEEKGFEEIEVTREDEIRIREMSTDPEIYSKITGSIAPSIYGYDEVKEAIALQLFSGLPKELSDGSMRRGDIHVLLIGDPGVAKSQCLRYVQRIAPRGIFASGRGSTAAGLTATAVRDNEFGDGRWTLEAGALVLADMGIACVDELEKMEADDRSAMHEAMEGQRIEVHKAGINTTLKSRCSVLAAANPKYGRFDPYEPMAKQINLPPALLSRFDLIFIIRDEPAVVRDTAISSHIFKAHVAGEMSLRKKKVKNAGITEADIAAKMCAVSPPIDSEMLRKYISYTKKTIFPILQPETEERLREFYLSLRKLGVDPNAPVPVTARQQEALIRLAEASARTRLSDKITVEDAERVIRIVMVSLNQTIKDPETGQLDSDIISTGMGKSQRERVKAVMQAILTLQGSNGNDVPLDLIVQTLEAEGLKKEFIEDAIKRLKSAGDLIETGRNRYRVVT